ncbi:GNAT family N-acetyltransferase [Magnetospira thiophila]
MRLAENNLDIEAAQALRYRVFYDEMGAQPTSAMARLKLDFDAFDDVCDHLLVIDKEKSNGKPWVVGTYRLLRKSVAEANFGFYSEQEYDLANLADYPGEIVEVGRSCVDPHSRSGAVMQLLWGGIAEYIYRHDIGLLFGCASFPGTQPEVLTDALSYLYQNHLAPEGLRPRALDGLYVDMRQASGVEAGPPMAMSGLPPLIKGYLRLGGFVGDGAVVDHQFNTTDICVVVKTDLVTEKYRRHYKDMLVAA